MSANDRSGCLAILSPSVGRVKRPAKARMISHGLEVPLPGDIRDADVSYAKYNTRFGCVKETSTVNIFKLVIPHELLLQIMSTL